MSRNGAKRNQKQCGPPAKCFEKRLVLGAYSRSLKRPAYSNWFGNANTPTTRAPKRRKPGHAPGFSGENPRS
jgi:hypothetical protein